jgi:hypothetical protein
MIPIIALFGGRWIGGIAVLLLFPHACPLLVELYLSRLRGKRDQHIVQVLGLCACQETIPDHRIAVDPREATRLAYATALRDVVQHRDYLSRFSLGAKERRTLPRRKPCLTGPAVQQAQVLVLPVAPTDGQVASTTLAMIAALLIVTAKPREIVHCFPSICITQLANACPW